MKPTKDFLILAACTVFLLAVAGGISAAVAWYGYGDLSCMWVKCVKVKP